MTQFTTQTVVVAGGGSGGHVYPVIEVVRALHGLSPTLQFVYIGQHGGAEAAIVARAGLPFKLPFHGITADKLRRYWDLRILALPFAVLAGTGQAFRLLLKIRPIAVLCKGGYVGVPVAIAAWLLRIPIVLHETDAVMGLANRMIAPFADRIAVSFPRHNLSTRHRRHGKLAYTGHPVRSVFYQAMSSRHEVERPHIAVIGGSQGATPINNLMKEILPELVSRYTVTHVTGPHDFGALSTGFQHRHYHPLEYAYNMVEVLRDADLVVSRSGGTVFELAALGKPAILIPIPSSANNHQFVNASILAEAGAAVLVEEPGLTSKALLTRVRTLLSDSVARASLATNIRQFTRPDAAAQVARLILEVAEQ